MGCLTYCPQRARRAAISGSALRQMTHISFLCGAAAFVGRSGRIGAARGRGEIQAEDNMGKGLQRKMLIGALLASVAMVSACGKKDEAASSGGAETVKVGVLHSLSGTMAISEVDRKEHTSELQPLMSTSYADFCLKKQ